MFDSTRPFDLIEKATNQAITKKNKLMLPLKVKKRKKI